MSDLSPHLAPVESTVLVRGHRFPLATWEPPAAVQGTVLALHAFGDFRHAFELAGPVLARSGWRVHAYDQRGFGEMARPGRWPHRRELVADLRAMTAELRPAPDTPYIVLGESLGGAIALVAAAEGLPGVDGLVLLEPAVRLGYPNRRLWNLVVGSLALVAPGYSRPLDRAEYETFTAATRRRLGRDLRATRHLRADAYRELLWAADEASLAARRVQLPTLLLFGHGRGIIPLDLFARTERDMAGRVTSIVYPDADHLLLQAVGWEDPVADLAAWMAGMPPPVSATGELRCRGPLPGRLIQEDGSESRGHDDRRRQQYRPA